MENSQEEIKKQHQSDTEVAIKRNEDEIQAEKAERKELYGERTELQDSNNDEETESSESNEAPACKNKAQGFSENGERTELQDSNNDEETESSGVSEIQRDLRGYIDQRLESMQEDFMRAIDESNRKNRDEIIRRMEEMFGITAQRLSVMRPISDVAPGTACLQENGQASGSTSGATIPRPTSDVIGTAEVHDLDQTRGSASGRSRAGSTNRVRAATVLQNSEQHTTSANANTETEVMRPISDVAPGTACLQENGQASGSTSGATIPRPTSYVVVTAEEHDLDQTSESAESGQSRAASTNRVSPATVLRNSEQQTSGANANSQTEGKRPAITPNSSQRTKALPDARRNGRGSEEQRRGDTVAEKSAETNRVRAATVLQNSEQHTTSANANTETEVKMPVVLPNSWRQTEGLPVVPGGIGTDSEEEDDSETVTEDPTETKEEPKEK